MRIWDVRPNQLCRQHLLAEHRELHGLWNILTKHGGKGGYAKHPETLRWAGKTKALFLRHQDLVKEFKRRGYRHQTPLNPRLARGQKKQKKLINSLAEQRLILRQKPCSCYN